MSLNDDDITTTTGAAGAGGDADAGDSDATQVDPSGSDPAGVDPAGGSGGDADAGDSDSTQVDPSGSDPAGVDPAGGSAATPTPATPTPPRSTPPAPTRRAWTRRTADVTAELERELAAPVPTGTGAAPSPLARCFETTPERFAAEQWNRRPLLVRAAERASSPVRGFDDLLSPADVDALLGPRGLRTPFFAMVKDGTSLPRSSYTRSANAGNQRLGDMPDPDGIAKNHAEGATIVLNALHRVWPALGCVLPRPRRRARVPDADQRLRHPAGRAGLQAPPRHPRRAGAAGRRPQALDHPPPGGRAAAAHAAEQGPGPDPVGGREPIVDTVLEPGDALYCRAGTCTRRRPPTTAPSTSRWGCCHDLADVLTDLLTGAGKGGGEDSSRCAAPCRCRSRPRDRRAWRPTSPSSGARRSRGWSSSTTPPSSAWSPHGRRQAVPLEPVGPLSQDRAARTLGPDGAVRPRVGLHTRVRSAGERVELLVGQRTVSFPGWVEPALRAALSGPSSPSSLAGSGAAIDVDDAQVLLRRLLRERVLVPADGSPEGLR